MEIKIGKCRVCATDFDYEPHSPQSHIPRELHFCPVCKEPLFHVSAVTIEGIHQGPVQPKAQFAVV